MTLMKMNALGVQKATLPRSEEAIGYNGYLTVSDGYVSSAKSFRNMCMKLEEMKSYDNGKVNLIFYLMYNQCVAEQKNS